MNNFLSISHGQSPGQSSTWVERYSKKHRPRRVNSFPGAIEPPKKVRIYARGDGFLLQFWDPSQKRTLSERIEGDLITAIVQAREIDQRLVCYKRSGNVAAYRHDELAARYLDDLNQRCAAGEIDATTVERYGSAIRCHYLPFCDRNETRRFPTIEKVDREFQLAFSTYLKTTLVSANGHKNSRFAPMKESGQEYAHNVVRAMYSWAADPQRGNMLPHGFLNPFHGRKRSSTSVTPNLISTLDINVQMAIDLIDNCDSFQLPIFGALLLYGLRPGELGWMFHEEIEAKWVQVPCKPELDYYTKVDRIRSFHSSPTCFP